MRSVRFNLFITEIYVLLNIMYNIILQYTDIYKHEIIKIPGPLILELD